MAGRGLQSLAPLLVQVDKERSAQLQHFDSLDSKAGILLGLASALIALSGGGHPIFIGLGRVAAVCSAAGALSTFWPRGIGVVNMKELRTHYLGADEAFTKRALLDSQIEMLSQIQPELRTKAHRLKDHDVVPRPVGSSPCGGLAPTLTQEVLGWNVNRSSRTR